MCTAIIRNPDPQRPHWLIGEEPLRIITAHSPSQILSALAEVECAVARGLWAVGFVTYEAAAGFDPCCAVHEPHSTLPLLWFALFPRLREIDHLPPQFNGDFHTGPWDPGTSRESYRAAIERIKQWIASGDTYQVNYTLRHRAAFHGVPEALFARLWANQQAPFSAFLDLPGHAICSASPELFFDLDGQQLTSRPMKGTLPRGVRSADDAVQRARLAASAKDRAENAMIVDMVRNDMGRIADVGSVHVRDPFTIERYPTVFQMTSSVHCRTSASLSVIFQALFPCASITGAPKLRTMQIIRELEPQPRGLYTGAIGWIAPGRRARFNVAIRTVVIDKAAGQAEYGVGGGIVWDSDPDLELAECQAKSAILTARPPTFDLLETLRFEPAQGYWLLEEHLRRLCDSADYFDRPLDLRAIRTALDRAVLGQTGRCRVRLLVAPAGHPSVEVAPAPPKDAPGPYRLTLSPIRVDPADRLLYHKTTHRDLYDAARAHRGDCDDVLLCNIHGHVTETTIANIVAELDGELVTPPVESGLLPGIFRAQLLATGRIRERIVHLNDLPRCTRLFAINSLRGWLPASLH